MNFEFLVNNIQLAHHKLQQSALRSLNLNLTIRNWLIGFYIVEFEQKGEDRANYGEKLLENLALSLEIKGLGYRNLKLFRQFYFVYPQIGHSLNAQFEDFKDLGNILFSRQLFVSKYELELPTAKQLEDFIRRELEK